MINILRLDASARIEGSLSRKLANTFEQILRESTPNTQMVRRDIGSNPPFIICEQWIAASFEAPETRTAEQNKRLSLSDTLIEELETADIILLSTPMYNYGMPAALKAWVDQVVRINKTFTFDLTRGDCPLEPILSNKSLVLMTSSGEFGFDPGGLNASHNHLVPHIRTIGKYLGIEELHHIPIEYQEFKDTRHERSIEDAHAAATKLAHQISAKRHMSSFAKMQA